jgi:hypothetical protein
MACGSAWAKAAWAARKVAGTRVIHVRWVAARFWSLAAL